MENDVLPFPSNSVITTGGGFSSIFTDKDFNLDFQLDAVSNYMSQMDGNILAGYPTNGRGLPDISAAASSYEILLKDKIGVVDGTSASCPVMAGITARISIENGGQKFGNILPLLYNSSNVFVWFDVTSGQNSGNGKQTNCPPGGGPIQGFEAREGWDPATGIGTLGTGIGYADYAAVLTNAPPPASGAATLWITEAMSPIFFMMLSSSMMLSTLFVVF